MSVHPGKYLCASLLSGEAARRKADALSPETPGQGALPGKFVYDGA